ncbi:MAG: helix-turn-helix domain-containing protein [Micrococcales bacterium]|nr:helix-turn-helix domain-containing protein [Micrococcales bacterium]MCL2667447.1 helix-turn-helix domain-containing protein [Micrococcales bacterium]
MTVLQTSYDVASRRAVGDRRTHIITLLRDADEPLSVADVAEQVGVHVNTARFHLESLVYASLARREIETRPGPGRPRVVYTNAPPQVRSDQPGGFAQLAQILASAVADANPDAGSWLYGVGQDWGRFLTAKALPFATVDEAEVASGLVTMLDDLGFAPELDRSGDTHRLWLHRCPFVAMAQRHPGVPCQLHAGLVNGALEEMRSSLRLTEQESSTGRCLGILGPAPDVAVTSVPLRG